MNTIQSVRRYDYGEITSIEHTPQGFLKVPGFATRTGVFTYIDAGGQVRRELRHPDDVFDPESLATLKNAPVTLEHPPVMLTPENVKDYMKGYTTDRVEVNRDLVETDLIIAVEDAIRAVEVHGMRELSSGYMADLEEAPGVYNGNDYDVRQRNIKYNHLAIVKKGRAGPEARLRLDSADAVMSVVSAEGNPAFEKLPMNVVATPANEFGTEAENDDSEEAQTTKTIVISGEKVELPVGIADIVQDMMDRYDQMRGEVAKLKEDTMGKTARKDDYGMKDVDINQKGVSPQVDVKQMAPDGRGESKKFGPADPMGPSRAKGTADDEDQHGVVGGQKPNSYEGGSKALQDNEPGMAPPKKDGEMPFEKKGDEVPGDQRLPGKQDYEGEGAGVAMSPADRLKKEIEEMEQAIAQMKGKHDAMMGKLDEMANQSFAQAEKKGNDSEEGGEKMDSASFRSRVKSRVRLEKIAEQLVPTSLSSRFDSLSDDEIRATVIKHRCPKADLRGKSTVYLQSRFDTIAESLEESVQKRHEMGGALLFGTRDGSRMDAQTDLNPHSARMKMVSNSRNEWQSPLSAVKK